MDALIVAAESKLAIAGDCQSAADIARAVRQKVMGMIVVAEPGQFTVIRGDAR